MPTLRIPSRNGLLWITGVTSAAVIGIIEAPLAIVFAAVPIVNEYLNRGGSTRSGTTSSGSVTSSSRRRAGSARPSSSGGAKATSAKRSTARRSTGRRGARRAASS